MDLQLSDKVALVGGASKGLGFAMARSLAAEGAKVVLCSREEEALAEAGRQLVALTGADVITVPCDVSRLDQVDRWIDQALGAHERVDILVNNAGGPPPGAFDDLDDSRWGEAYDLLLRPVVHAIRRVLPGMRERGWGRILNLTSVSVVQPVGGLMLSNSLRAAVAGMARTLAAEVGPHGITVNNLAPGYFATERLGQLIEDGAARRGTTVAEMEASFEARVPAGRLGRPEELGDLAAFLCSPRAGYINGVTWLIDGGLVTGALG